MKRKTKKKCIKAIEKKVSKANGKKLARNKVSAKEPSKRVINVKPLVGREPKLTKENMIKIRQFFNEYEPYYDLPVEKQLKDGTVITEMKRVANGLPNPKKLADFLGVNRTTIYYWISRYPEFSNIYKRLRDNSSKETIVENAMLGEYNGQFAKAYMENELDWRDQEKQDKEAPKQVFTQQINYFLSQQGLDNIPNLPQKNVELPAFKDD